MSPIFIILALLELSIRRIFPVRDQDFLAITIIKRFKLFL
jgi:hypothetical protein